MEEEFQVMLTKTEIEYIWLLTAQDALRIYHDPSDEVRQAHGLVRHSLRRSLFATMYPEEEVYG